jgi:hypothetical protein
MTQQRLDRAQVHSALKKMGGKTMPQSIIILLTNSLSRKSITDITRFMERKSK